MLDAIGEAVIATDLDGTILFWNAAAERMYGWSAEEVLGRSVIEVTPSPASRAEAAQIMAAMQRGEPWRGRFEVRRRDGTTFPALVTDSPWMDERGELVGIIGVSADVSPLEAANARARRGERHVAVAELARAALETADVRMVLDRAVGVVAEVCRVPLVLVAERDGEGGLRRVAGRGWGPGDDGWMADVGALPSLLGNAPVIVEDYADGPRPPLLAAHGVCAGVGVAIGGRPGGYGLLGAYASEPRAFDPDDVAFLQSVAGLVGGAVARSDGEARLRRVAEELRTSDGIRLAFLRATSHELRTPLAAVRGFAETLREHDVDLDPSERDHLLQVLVQNAERLDRLIQDLLDVDRLSTGLTRAMRRACRLDLIVAKMADVVDHSEHRLELDLDEVTAELDVPKIERVVQNLLDNAVRHTPSGGRIMIRLRATDGEVVLTVDDEGPGIAQDDLDRIFEPFVQGPEQREAAAPGTGLGLALAREITLLHGGTVAATNRPSGGARFEVRLPT
jgi:PAS domain S-box-containing protein